MQNGKIGEPPLVRAAEDRHKEYSTKILVHNFAAVYELAGGCFFQDLNDGWPFGPTPPPGTVIGNAGHGGAVELGDALEMMMGDNELNLHQFLLEGPPIAGAANNGAPPLLNQQDDDQDSVGGELNDDDPPVLIHDSTPTPDNFGLPNRPRSSTLAWIALPSRRTLGLNVDDNAPELTPTVDNYPSPQAQVPSSSELPQSGHAMGTTNYKPQWYTVPFDFKVADLCVDVERDLLVVIERSDASKHV